LEHRHWTSEDWQKVAFSDESKFNLFGSDGKRYVRRPKNTRNECKYTHPTVKFGGGNVMVWGMFSSSGTSSLVRVEGRMDAALYKNILENNLLLFAKNKMGVDWIFQYDNDPKHTSKLVKSWPKSQNIRVLKWPAQSPDLNPIELLAQLFFKCLIQFLANELKTGQRRRFFLSLDTCRRS
jgi:hypothetical protein